MMQEEMNTTHAAQIARSSALEITPPLNFRHLTTSCVIGVFISAEVVNVNRERTKRGCTKIHSSAIGSLK